MIVGACGSARRVVAALLLIGAPCAAKAETDGAKRARELFHEATRLYAAGDWTEAATRFEGALELADRPSLHFNLARTYERLGRRRDAGREYRAYLAGAPEAPDRADVEAALTRLEESELELPTPALGTARGRGGDEELPRVALEPLPLPSLGATEPWSAPDSELTPRRASAWAAFGVAGASAVAATILGILALSSRAEVDGAKLVRGSDGDQRRIAAVLERAETQARYADLLGLATLVAAGTGVWLWPEALADVSALPASSAR